MSSAKEFREYARECMDWARTARSEKERAVFVEMAQTWLVAAARQEVGLAESSENDGSSNTPMCGPAGQYTAKPASRSNDNNPNQ